MKKRFIVWAISAALLLLTPFLSKAQPYRKLSVADFTGVPPTDNYFAAYTFCYVHYSYTATRRNGIYNLVFDVQLEFNGQRSWIRRDQINSNTTLANVIDHEQGHYNIAWLMRNELNYILSHHRYTANYQNEITNLFKGVDAKYRKLNDDYENQTIHMTDRKKQLRWDNWFNTKLNDPELAENRGPVNKWQ